MAGTDSHMKKESIILIFLVAFSLNTSYGKPLSAVPQSPITYECSIRCHKDGKWLHDLNHSFLICSELPNSLQQHVDGACAEVYGGDAKGYLNYPAAPGTLVACKTVGSKCSQPGLRPTIWQCPASCRGPAGTYPTFLTVCAVSQRFAYSEGLRAYRTDGPLPLCKHGDTLGATEMAEPFNDPPTSLCKNTQKECEL